MSKYRFLLITLFTLLIAVSCSAGSGGPTSPDDLRDVSNNRTEDELGIAVSPQTFLLSSEQSGKVTVHTFIPYGIVDKESLELNGVPVRSTKADNRGNLVAFFDELEVEATVAPPEAVMFFTGATLDGNQFKGSDTVKVIE